MSRPSSQKRRPAILATSVAVLFSLGFLLGTQKAAADQYWDGTTTGGSGNSNGQGGSGTWDSSTTNWVDASGNNPTTYDSNQTSIFSTSGGTITLGNDTSFSSLRFEADGYTVDPGGGPFKLSAQSGTGVITAVSGVTVVFNTQLTGSGVMSFQGGGTITLTSANSSANDYTGGTTIGSGGTGPTVIINADTDLGVAGSTITLDGGTLQTTASITSSRAVNLVSTGTFAPDTSTTLTLNGLVGGSGTLVVNGAGAVQLGNTGNSYTGGTVIRNGTLVISADGNLGGSGSNIAFSSPGGTLRNTASVGTSRSITLNSTGNLSPDGGTILEIGGQITGTGGLNLIGAGTVQLDGSTNNYTGATNIATGTLRTAATNALSSSSAMTIGAGATLELNGFSQTVASLNGSGTVNTSGGTLTTGGSGGSTTYLGTIQGSGGLTKTGTGTMTLTGVNTYTGRTTVTGGKLIVDPTTHFATGGLSSSSTLVLGGGTGSGIFQQNGVAGQAVTQVLNGLIINAGQDNKIIVNNLGTSTTLDLRGSSGTAGIVHNGGAVDFSSATGLLNTTTAVIKTHQANDASGVIGAWATVNGGADLAANNGSDIIVAYTGYTNIAARGDVVPNGAGLNVRINSAGTSGNDTLASTTTNINTLTQNTATDSTIDLAGGTLRVGTSGGVLITPSGTNLTIGTAGNPGTLTAGGATNNTAGQLTLNNSSTASLLTINSVIADNGTGVVSVVTAGTNTTVFANTNTYTGSTTISGGTLRTDVANAIPTHSAVLVNSGATLDLNNHSATVGSISNGSAGGGTIALGSATLTVGTNNTNTSYSGAITGTGSFVKTGTGTTTLSNSNNTYSGGTTLNSGRLNANGSATDGTGTPLGSGVLTINGGTLGTTIQPTSGTSGTNLTNAISVHGDFSVATNVNTSSPGSQNLTLSGPIDLTGATRTITGIVNGGQVHFGAGGIGVTGETAGVNFNTTFTKSGDYVAFILDPGNTNKYTGVTTVNNGAFVVFEGTTTDGAIKGNVDIEGNGVVDYINGSSSVGQIVDTATVTVNSSGNTLSGSHFDGLELRGASDTIGTLNGTGSVGLGSGTLTVGAGNFSGVIEDGAFGSGGSLVKNTAGTLILSGANTNTGATSITAGTLQAGATNTLSKGSAVTVASGATLNLNSFNQNVASINGSGNVTLGSGTLTVGGTNATNTFSGTISGTGGLTKIGTGTFTLNGTNSYTGPTTVTRGKLLLSPTSTTPVLDSHSGLIVGGTTLNDGGFFQLDGVAATTTTQILNGLTVNAGNNIVAVNNTGTTTTLDLRGLSGTAGITRNANGFVDFRAITGTLGVDAIIRTHQANDASGILGAWATVNGGSDFATNQGDIIVGLSTVAGGYHDIAATFDTVPNGANFNVRINSAVGPGSSVNDIIATHPVTSINTLTQNFTTASTVDLAGGTLKLGADGGILITPGSASLTIGATSNDGVLTATSTPSSPATITLANNSAVGTLTINSAITDAGGGPVSVRLTGTGTTVFGGTNTYSGSTAILSGTLRTDLANSLPSTTAVTLNSGATLNLNNNSQTVASINSGPNGGGNIALGTATLTIGGNSNSSVTGVISGTGGGLVKNGTGTLSLSGTNIYTGSTTLNSGRLNVDNGSALGTGTLIINGGTIGTTVAGGVTFNNAVIVGGSFSVATNVNAASPTNQILAFNGTVNLGSTGPTITGITPGGRVKFQDVVSGSNGVTFTTAPNVASDVTLPYVLFSYSSATANTYTGKTTVKENAILALQVGTSGAGATAILGDVDIEGKGSVYYNGGANFSNQIADNATVTVNSGGNAAAGVDGLELGGASDTIGTLNGNSTGKVGLGDGTLTISMGGTFNGVIENGDFAQFTGGSLAMTGSGTLTLGGKSTYFGSTTISSGKILTTIDNALPAFSAVLVNSGAVLDINNHTQQIGSLANGGGGGGTVNLGSSSGLLVTGFDNTSTTFSGVIKDGGNTLGTGGSFFKVGTGTLTLSGSNTYSGQTDIFGGTIKAGAVNTIPSASAVGVNNGATFDLNDFSQTIGSLSNDFTTGSGGSVKLGALSTTTLTTGGDNTDSIFSGIIQGAGNVTKVGTGTFTLTGANIYLGNTTLNAGGITILGSLASTVIANNTTGITRLVNGGTITGSGGVSVNALGSAGITIGDFGTFTNAVNLGTGINTVVIGTGIHRTPISAPAGNHDTLRLVGGGLDTLKTADFRGYEFLDKAGGGQWNLTGTNPFSGGTLVEAGTLNVRGSLISNTTISSLGTLSGTGIVTGNVLNSGIVNPGEPTAIITTTNKPGTLTLRGNYQQGSSGALVIQLNGIGANQFSHLAISGRAQLDGGLLLQNNGSVVPLKLGQKLTFLTADAGVSGKFSAVDTTIPTGTVVVGTVVYDANTVSVQGAQGSFRSINNQFHLTANQNAVAATLDSAAADKRAAKLIAFLDNRPLKKLPGDFDQIAPEEMASVYRLGVSLSDVQARNVQRRTADLRAGTSGFSASGFQTTGGANYSGGLAGPNGSTGKDGKDGKSADQPDPERRWGTFITGVGDFAHVGDSGNARGYDLNTGGVTVGADYKLTPHIAVGVTAGYAGTNANLTDDGRLLVNSGRLGVYGTYYTGGYYADAAVTGAATNYSTRRSSLEGVASGSTQGGSMDVLVNTGYDWRMDALTIGPTASFQYTYVGIDGFTERGSLTPLRYAGQHQSSIRSNFGLRVAYDWKVGGVLLRPEATLAWQHEYGDRSYSIDSALASGAGDAFSVSDTQIGRDSLLFGAGVAVLWNPRTSTYLYYDADLLKKEYNSQSVSGGLRLNF